MASSGKLLVMAAALMFAILSLLIYLQTSHPQGHVIQANYQWFQRQLFDNATNEDFLSSNPGKRTSSSKNIAQLATTVADKFMSVHRREQKIRRAVLVAACKKNGVHDSRNIFKDPPKLIVNEEHQVLYCNVPKAACTSWKKVFLVMDKFFKTTAEISQFYTNRSGRKSLKTLDEYSPSEVRTMLKTYTKFLFARNPFSRILSAFKNKLEPNSTFERALHWQRSLGKRIIKKYREKDRPIASTQYDLTFEEFVKFLVDPGINSNNKHWDEIHKRCLPCNINYNIIGKFETLNSDAKYVMKVIRVDDIEFPGYNSSSPTGSSNQSQLELHYKRIPDADLIKLYEKFHIDFELFGYEFRNY